MKSKNFYTLQVEIWVFIKLLVRDKTYNTEAQAVFTNYTLKIFIERKKPNQLA